MIRGQKVDLVGVSMSYLPYYLRWINDPDVTDMLGDVRFPMSEEKEREWVEEQLIPRRESRVFTILTKKAQPIGNIAFNHIDHLNRNAVIGIMIGEKQFWSKGYGTDAIATLLRFGFEELQMRKIELYVDDNNKRAIVCYKKCGFVVEGRARKHRFYRGRYYDDLQMGILREEWERSVARKRRGKG